MFEKIANWFDIDLKMVVLLEGEFNSDTNYNKFVSVFRKFLDVDLVMVPSTERTVAIMKMRGRRYLPFMSELQRNGLNLKQLHNNGLLDKLVYFKRN